MIPKNYILETRSLKRYKQLFIFYATTKHTMTDPRTKKMGLKKKTKKKTKLMSKIGPEPFLYMVRR